MAPYSTAPVTALLRAPMLSRPNGSPDSHGYGKQQPSGKEAASGVSRARETDGSTARMNISFHLPRSVKNRCHDPMGFRSGRQLEIKRGHQAPPAGLGSVHNQSLRGLHLIPHGVEPLDPVLEFGEAVMRTLAFQRERVDDLPKRDQGRRRNSAP